MILKYLQNQLFLIHWKRITNKFFPHPFTDTDSVCLDPDSLSLSGGCDLEEGVQFSIWVSFYEIYNEFLYDLLDASPAQQPRKRVTLRLSDDKQGNPYVKGNSRLFTIISLKYFFYEVIIVCFPFCHIRSHLDSDSQRWGGLEDPEGGAA